MLLNKKHNNDFTTSSILESFIPPFINLKFLKNPPFQMQPHSSSSSCDNDDNNSNKQQCCPTVDNNQCGPCIAPICPPLPTNCVSTTPVCKMLIFNDDLQNFQEKINNGTWVPYAIVNPVVVANDGVNIQECDGVILETTKFTISQPHPYTGYHYAYRRPLPYNNTFNGVCVEAMISQITKYVKNVIPTQNNPNGTDFESFYESSGADPESDYRLAYSGFTINSTNGPTDDQYFATIAFSKKQIYLLYGVSQNNTGKRDRFSVAVPIMPRNGFLSETFIINLCVNYDGSIQAYLKDKYTCEYKCLLSIQNIGVPPKERKYITALYSASYAAAKLANPTSNPPPTFLYESAQLTNLEVIIGNFSDMAVMEPNPSNLPTTTLYTVLNDYTNQVIRYLCECDDTLTPAETIVTLPDGTPASTIQLNYGQGATLKLFKMSACYQ
jgi:hypothetical protein